MNHLWRVFLLIKTCFYVKIAENSIFRHNLLMVFFQGMFCKLVFCKLQNMGWPSNIAWNIQQRCLVKMAKATLHLWHSLTQFYKKGTPLIKNTTSQKWHPTEIAPHENGISHKWHLPKMSSENLHYWFSEVLPTPC